MPEFPQDERGLPAGLLCREASGARSALRTQLNCQDGQSYGCSVKNKKAGLGWVGWRGVCGSNKHMPFT